MQASAKKRRATTTIPPNPDSYLLAGGDFSGGSGSPVSGSCITEDATTELYSKLREIESAMLGEEEENNNDDVDSWRWARTADAIRGGDVRQVLTLCARAVADGELVVAEWLVEELRRMVSVSGEPLQRLGAYMLEGLVARIAPSESSICRLGVGVGASASSELLHELCPYFKFAYMSANGAIAEAMRDEARVHIVDFRLGKGSQWETLIQAFAARPAGPPRIRITAVADDTHCVAAVARRLSRLAAAFAVPFEFRTVSDPRTLTLKGELSVKHLQIVFSACRVVNFSANWINVILGSCQKKKG